MTNPLWHHRDFVTSTSTSLPLKDLIRESLLHEGNSEIGWNMMFVKCTFTFELNVQGIQASVIRRYQLFILKKDKCCDVDFRNYCNPRSLTVLWDKRNFYMILWQKRPLSNICDLCFDYKSIQV